MALVVKEVKISKNKEIKSMKISKNKEIKSMRTEKTMNDPNGALQNTERLRPGQFVILMNASDITHSWVVDLHEWRITTVTWGQD